MEKFKDKKKIKARGFFAHLFAYFSSVVSIFDDIEPFKTLREKKTFKSMMLAFQGKSTSEIKKQLKYEEFEKEEEMRKIAREKFEQEK